MCCSRRIEKIRCADRVINVKVFLRVDKERTFVLTIRQRKAVSEWGCRAGRCKIQIFDDLEGKIKYWKTKDEVEGGKQWRIRQEPNPIE